VRRAAGVLLLAAVTGACGRGAATAGTVAPDAGGAPVADASSPARIATPDPRLEDLWTRAGEGEEVDLARLYDREGERGLMERAGLPVYRLTAIQALGCAEDFTALPFLAAVAISGTDAEAEAALESAETLAARAFRSRDPEDALELREGCDGLVTLARQVELPRPRRARAVSALRMLTATGCVRPEAIPIDLDPK